MTLQNISRLAALIAQYFREMPRFEYRAFPEKQAEGNFYPFGSFVLILRRQDLGLAVLPELFPVPDGYELRQGRRILTSAQTREQIPCAYRFWLEREQEYRIVIPEGESFDQAELVERQRGFLQAAVEAGFQPGFQCRHLLAANREGDDNSRGAKSLPTVFSNAHCNSKVA